MPLSNNKKQIIGPMDFDEALIQKELPTIIVDGALNHTFCASLDQIFTDFKIVGDNDSNKTEIQFDHLLDTNKNMSDFSYALKLHQSQAQHVLALGFLNQTNGDRLDHEFSNILEAVSFCQVNQESIVSFEDKIMVCSKSKLTLRHTGIFSLFTLEKFRISITGEVKFPLQDEVITPFSSHGLSNEAFGDLLISNPENKAYILYL